MTPTVGKKLSLFVAAVVLVTTGGIGFVSYHLMEARVSEVLRKDTLDTATLLSSRVRNELRHVAEKGRVLAAAALEEFKNPDDQIRFLEDNLAMDDQFIALSLFRRSGASNGEWAPVFRLTRPEDDPSHLAEDDFKMLDLKYPLDFKLVAEGAVEISVGSLKDGTPILRMAVPIARKKGVGFTQLLGIELRQERITAAFTEATAHFSFVLDRNGRVLSQTDPTHFTLGEDLSHLPILEMARATEAPNGNLDYHELPGGPLQFGSFHKVGYADLTVVTQAPKSLVIQILRIYTKQAGFLALACMLLAAAFTLLATWSIIGARLARVGNAIQKLGKGKFSAKFPEQHSGDEIGDFARKLQQVFDELDGREKVHGTFAKIRNRKAKALLEEGKLNLKGERTQALVVHCHLHALEAVVAKAEPELLIEHLNRFNQEVSELIERNQGIVDHIHGGSIVAYWGVPVASKDNADRALDTCLGIREAVKALNQSFVKAKLPKVSLGMGMHYGPVVAGQIGTADRMEYTAFGEALEVASRIQSFTDQFGTDFLLTGAAARRAPEHYKTEQVSAGDATSPELFELVSSTKRRVMPAEYVEPEEAEETEADTVIEAKPEAELEAGANISTAPELPGNAETGVETGTEESDSTAA